MFRITGRKVEIQKKEAFCQLMRELPFRNNISIKALLESWDTRLKALQPTITSGALSNCHGDWYEWILAIAAWNQRINSGSNKLALLLPNIRALDANTLYHGDIFDLIEDLKVKVTEAANVSFITSNPDLVILSQETFADEFNRPIDIRRVTVEQLDEIEAAHGQFIGLLEFDQLLGYLSVKSSLRPDRRLQIPHEGSLVKAIHQHIITRKWIVNPTPLRYYAVSTEVGPADRLGLKTIATHSIITVNQVPVSAVDEVYEVDSYSSALELFETLYTF